MAKPRLPANLQAWVEARRRFQLSDAHIQMARELGMNPNKLGGLANHRQETWKAPLPEFIEELYERRFGRRRPERVRSLEERAADLTQKKASRRQRRAAERRHGSELGAVNQTGDTAMSQVSARQMNVRREAATVQACAAAQAARVISLGPLLFFSTESGDAWVLEPADRLARCLARSGVASPTGIVETSDTFSIEWEATYALDGATFVVADGDGRVSTIVGYPVDAIRHVLRLVEAG